MWDFLRGKRNDVVQLVPAGEVNSPDPSLFSLDDGFHYVPPLTVPTPFEAINGEIHYNKGLEERFISEAMTPFQTQFGTPYAQGKPFAELAMSTVLFPLMEWNWTTRRYILEQCHNAWERMPLAKTAVRYNRLFSVQNGFTCSYKNSDVGDILDRFIEDPRNNVRENDKMFVEALCKDGELFIRYFVGGKATRATTAQDSKAMASGGGYYGKTMIGEPANAQEPSGQPGEVVIAPLRPWYILWIRANPDNFREVFDYRYTGSVSDGSGQDWSTFSIDIPADEIHHVAINRMPYEQRGRPELFCILPYLQGHKRFLEDRARLNAFKGGVYDVTLKNGTPTQVAARAQSYKKPFQAGTVLVHNDNESIQTMSADIGANDASEDGRQLRLMVAAGMSLPEYMLADGSNANLASASAQALPALKTFGEWQDVMRDQVWKPIFKRVIQEAIDARLIPEEVEEQKSDGTPILDDAGNPVMCKAVNAFDVVYPDLETLDTMDAVQAIMATVNGGFISEETATSLLPWPIDYDEEQKKIAKEKQKAMDDMMSGRMPTPPGIDPATGKPLPILPPDERSGRGMAMGPEMTPPPGYEEPEGEKDSSNGNYK